MAAKSSSWSGRINSYLHQVTENIPQTKATIEKIYLQRNFRKMYTVFMEARRISLESQEKEGLNRIVYYVYS